jgi:hypothetical protein
MHGWLRADGWLDGYVCMWVQALGKDSLAETVRAQMSNPCADRQDETGVQGTSGAMYLVGFLPGVNTEWN